MIIGEYFNLLNRAIMNIDFCHSILRISDLFDFLKSLAK